MAAAARNSKSSNSTITSDPSTIVHSTNPHKRQFSAISDHANTNHNSSPKKPHLPVSINNTDMQHQQSLNIMLSKPKDIELVQFKNVSYDVAKTLQDRFNEAWAKYSEQFTLYNNCRQSINSIAVLLNLSSINGHNTPIIEQLDAIKIAVNQMSNNIKSAHQHNAALKKQISQLQSNQTGLKLPPISTISKLLSLPLLSHDIKCLKFDVANQWMNNSKSDCVVSWKNIQANATFGAIFDIFNSDHTDKLQSYIIPILKTNKVNLHSTKSMYVVSMVKESVNYKDIRFGMHRNIKPIYDKAGEEIICNAGIGFNTVFNTMVIICVVASNTKSDILYQGYKLSEIFDGSPVIAGLIPTSTHCSISQLATDGKIEYHDINVARMAGVAFALTNTDASINIISSLTKKEKQNVNISYVLLFGYRNDIEKEQRVMDYQLARAFRNKCMKFEKESQSTNISLIDLYK